MLLECPRQPWNDQPNAVWRGNAEEIRHNAVDISGRRHGKSWGNPGGVLNLDVVQKTRLYGLESPRKCSKRCTKAQDTTTVTTICADSKVGIRTYCGPKWEESREKRLSPLLTAIALPGEGGGGG